MGLRREESIDFQKRGAALRLVERDQLSQLQSNFSAAA
jgi:hypothetical protein